MALRLSRKLNGPRRIDLGYGVAITVAPFTFAQFKEAEAAALRLSEEARSQADAALFEALDDEDLPPEAADAVRGSFGQALLRILLVRHGTGWEGIETDDGTPAPMTHATIGDLLDLFPGVAQVLSRDLMAPFHALVSEGNGSAPSQGTATPAG
jgi:hypothetical protein